MPRLWIKPTALFEKSELLNAQLLCVENGVVTDVVPACAEGAPDNVQALSGVIAPGFIDLQVNGGGGVLFNNATTPEDLDHIANAHRKFGTTSILPTLITDAARVMAKGADAVLASDQSGVLGIHLEGPHIAPAKRGTHALDHVRPFDTETFNLLERLRAANVFTMVTLAPEVVAPSGIERIVELGVTVALGHSDATQPQVQAALDAGAHCFTHLFNAMSPMQGREPGMVGAAINSSAYVGIIADGHHVDFHMVALACRARPERDKMFLVSDAMPTLGGPDTFELYGQRISVEDGKLINAEGNLAGAHTSLSECLANMVEHVGTEPEDALRMAITTPAEIVLRPDLSSVVGRQIDDLVVLGDGLTFKGSLNEILRS